MVFANKQDLPNALSVTELTEKLGLNTLRRKVRSIKRINLTYTGNNLMPVTFVTVTVDHISHSTHVEIDPIFATHLQGRCIGDHAFTEFNISI